MRPDPDRLLEILPRYDQAGPRYTSYPTAPTWSDDFGPADARAALARLTERELSGFEAVLAAIAHEAAVVVRQEQT